MSMYTKKNHLYAEPGKYLKGPGFIGFDVEGDASAFTEKDIDLTDLTVREGLLVCSGGDIVIAYHPEYGYDEYKRYFIRMRYSNDDQIAIMLNRENGGEDLEEYERMQAWREWSAGMAKRVLALPVEGNGGDG